MKARLIEILGSERISLPEDTQNKENMSPETPVGGGAQAAQPPRRPPPPKQSPTAPLQEQKNVGWGEWIGDLAGKAQEHVTRGVQQGVRGAQTVFTEGAKAAGQLAGTDAQEAIEKLDPGRIAMERARRFLESGSRAGKKALNDQEQLELVKYFLEAGVDRQSPAYDTYVNLLETLHDFNNKGLKETLYEGAFDVSRGELLVDILSDYNNKNQLTEENFKRLVAADDPRVEVEKVKDQGYEKKIEKEGNELLDKKLPPQEERNKALMGNEKSMELKNLKTRGDELFKEKNPLKFMRSATEWMGSYKEFKKNYGETVRGLEGYEAVENIAERIRKGGRKLSETYKAQQELRKAQQEFRAKPLYLQQAFNLINKSDDVLQKLNSDSSEAPDQLKSWEKKYQQWRNDFMSGAKGKQLRRVKRVDDILKNRLSDLKIAGGIPLEAEQAIEVVDSVAEELEKATEKLNELNQEIELMLASSPDDLKKAEHDYQRLEMQLDEIISDAGRELSDLDKLDFDTKFDLGRDEVDANLKKLGEKVTELKSAERRHEEVAPYLAAIQQIDPGAKVEASSLEGVKVKWQEVAHQKLENLRKENKDVGVLWNAMNQVGEMIDKGNEPDKIIQSLAQVTETAKLYKETAKKIGAAGIDYRGDNVIAQRLDEISRDFSDLKKLSQFQEALFTLSKDLGPIQKALPKAQELLAEIGERLENGGDLGGRVDLVDQFNDISERVGRLDGYSQWASELESLKLDVEGTQKVMGDLAYAEGSLKYVHGSLGAWGRGCIKEIREKVAENGVQNEDFSKAERLKTVLAKVGEVQNVVLNPKGKGLEPEEYNQFIDRYEKIKGQLEKSDLSEAASVKDAFKKFDKFLSDFNAYRQDREPLIQIDQIVKAVPKLADEEAKSLLKFKNEYPEGGFSQDQKEQLNNKRDQLLGAVQEKDVKKLVADIESSVKKLGFSDKRKYGREFSGAKKMVDKLEPGESLLSLIRIKNKIEASSQKASPKAARHPFKKFLKDTLEKKPSTPAVGRKK